MKKYTAAVILAAIIVSAAGCEQRNDSLQNAESGITVSSDGAWIHDGLEIRRCSEIYGYDKLTQAGQMAFDLMYGEYYAETGNNTFLLPTPISADEFYRARALYQAATLRYKHLPWGYIIYTGPAKKTDTIHIDRNVSYDPEITVKQYTETKGKAVEIAAGMPPGFTDREKCLYIAEYLVQNVRYNNERLRFETDIGEITISAQTGQRTTTYAALIEGEANCVGYSAAFAALAYEAGINCIIVSGKVGENGHAWNMVQIDGDWYHIDATWMDNNGKLDETYFMIDDQQISKTHEPVSYAGCPFVPLPASGPSFYSSQSAS